MGESTVDAPKNVDKMGVAGGGALEVSISFGRFEHDSLSWERWSSFSPNKYLEEVEKCSTPGSVAMKKAYFEAHYKKVAARKAELMDQQKQMETDPLMSDTQNGEDLGATTREVESELHKSNDQCSVEGVKEETNLLSEESITNIDESKEEAAIVVECQSSSVEGEEDLNSGPEPDSPKFKKPEEAVLVKEEIPSIELQDKQENPRELNNGIKYSSRIKKEISKQDLSKKSQKTSAAKKERNVASVQKKPASPVPKSPQIFTPAVSRPKLTSTMTPTARSSTKKGTTSSLPRSKKSPTRQSRSVAPSSLHMSLSSGPKKSDPASPATTTSRKSLIMEKMGDKDIVKRAFKTFQNNMNQLKSSSEGKSSLPKQASEKGTEHRVSSSVTPRKDKEGLFDRSRKAGGGKISAKDMSSFSLRSNERAETRKEFLKKSAEKPIAREAEKAHLRSKLKEGKEAEIKKMRQSLNFKATPLPGFYRGQQLSKSLLDNKEGSKSEIHR